MNNFKKKVSIQNVDVYPDYSQRKSKESTSSRRVSYLVPDQEICGNNNFSGGKAESGFPPPPVPDGREDLWDLQFCRWWGWNWVRKKDNVELRGGAGDNCGECLSPKGLKKMEKRWKEYNKDLQRLRKQEDLMYQDFQTTNLPTKEQFKELCKCFFRPPPYQRTHYVEDIYRTPSQSVTALKSFNPFRRKSSGKRFSSMATKNSILANSAENNVTALPLPPLKHTSVQVTDSDEVHELMRSSTENGELMRSSTCNPRQSMRASQATRHSSVNPRQSMRPSQVTWNSPEVHRQSMRESQAMRHSSVNPRQSMGESQAMWDSVEDPRQSMRESQVMRDSCVGPRQSMRASQATRHSSVNPRQSTRESQATRHSSVNPRQSVRESQATRHSSIQPRISMRDPSVMESYENFLEENSPGPATELVECYMKNDDIRRKSSARKTVESAIGWAPYRNSMGVETSEEVFPEPMGQEKRAKRKYKSCRTNRDCPQTCTSEEIPHGNCCSDRSSSSTEESIEYVALRVSSFRTCPCHCNQQNQQNQQEPKRDTVEAQTSTFVFPLEDKDTQTSASASPLGQPLGQEKDCCPPCCNDGERYIKLGKKRKVLRICVCCCSCAKEKGQPSEPSALLQQSSNKALLKDISRQTFKGETKSPSLIEETRKTTTYNITVPPISAKAFSKFGTPSKNYSWIKNIGSDTTTASLNFPQTFKSPNSGKTYDFTSWNFNDRPNLTLPEPIDVSDDVTYLKQLQTTRKSCKEDRMLLDAVCDAILSEHELKFGSESDFEGRNRGTVVNKMNNVIRPKFQRKRPRMRIPRVPKIDNVFENLIQQVLKSDVEVYSSDEMYSNFEPVLNKLKSFSILASAYEQETNSLPSRRKKKRRAMQELNIENSSKKMKQEISTKIMPSVIPEFPDIRKNSCMVKSRASDGLDIGLTCNAKLEDIVAKIEEMMKRAQTPNEHVGEPITANTGNKRSYQMSSDVFTRTVSFTEQAGSLKKSYEIFSNRKDPMFDTFPDLTASSLVIPLDNESCPTEDTPKVTSGESLKDTKLSVQNFTVCDVTSSHSQKNVSVDEGPEKEPPTKKKSNGNGNSPSLIPIRRRNL